MNEHLRFLNLTVPIGGRQLAWDLPLSTSLLLCYSYLPFTSTFSQSFSAMVVFSSLGTRRDRFLRLRERLRSSHQPECGHGLYG